MHLLPADHLSSLAFTQGDFRPHGEFLCWMEDGLLMWESRGPFNLEALQAFGRTRQAAFARWGLDDRPLAAVMRWVGSALMSPEAFADWLAQEGIVSLSLNPDTVVDTWERLAARS